jgi:protein-disulfide isomerase
MHEAPFNKKPIDSFKPFLPVILKIAGTIILIIAILFGINYALNASAPTVEVKGDTWIPAYSMKEGKEDSKVKVVLFFDLQCSACKANEPALKNVISKLKDRVLFIHRNFPLRDIHPLAQSAGEGAQAASRQGLDKFLVYKEQVYALQSSLSPANITKAAENAGLDIDRWNKDRNGSVVEAEVNADYEFIRKATLPKSSFNGETNATGTPTTVVLVDDKPVNWYSGGLDEATQESEILKYLN